MLFQNEEKMLQKKKKNISELKIRKNTLLQPTTEIACCLFHDTQWFYCEVDLWECDHLYVHYHRSKVEVCVLHINTTVALALINNIIIVSACSVGSPHLQVK